MTLCQVYEKYVIDICQVYENVWTRGYDKHGNHDNI